MLPDDPRELEQLDALAEELREAGRIARSALTSREIPDPAFTARLRLKLVGSAAPASSSTAAVPPSRPLDLPALLDRRSSGRPLDTDRAAATTASGAVDEASRQAGPDSGRRWGRHEATAAERPLALPQTEPLDLEAARSGHAAALRPALEWRFPTRVLPARWVALGLAASLVVASFLYGTTIVFPARPYAVADVANNATVVRGGSASPLTQGAELYEGDEIRVAAGGLATLSMGGSFARMAGGSDMRLDGLGSSAIVVEQLGGRVYHRVVVGPEGKYEVVTGSVDWTATGTAFDLDRHSAAGGGEVVRGMALLDGLGLSGPSLETALIQGESATVALGPLGSPAAAPVVQSIGSTMLNDKWLIENARLDNLEGLDLGELAALLTPTPQPSPTPKATAVEPAADRARSHLGSDGCAHGRSDAQGHAAADADRPAVPGQTQDRQERRRHVHLQLAEVHRGRVRVLQARLRARRHSAHVQRLQLLGL